MKNLENTTGIEEVFKLANGFIRKNKAEIEEIEKQIEQKRVKIKKIQMALITIEEYCKQG